jgi:Cu2+-exporting ATPase
MKTSVIEVHDMLSVLSVDGVEQRLGEVPGVESATVNFAAGSATVRYDETRLEIADIRSAVRQSGYESAAPPAPLAPAAPKSAAPPAPAAPKPLIPGAAASPPGTASASAAAPVAAKPAGEPHGDEHKDERKTP